MSDDLEKVPTLGDFEDAVVTLERAATYVRCILNNVAGLNLHAFQCDATRLQKDLQAAYMHVSETLDWMELKTGALRALQPKPIAPEPSAEQAAQGAKIIH